MKKILLGVVIGLALCVLGFSLWKIYDKKDTNEKTYNDNSYKDNSSITYKIGDLTNDGVVDVKDALRLEKILSGEEEITRYYLLAGDLNNDGRLDEQDSKLLKEYLSGMGVDIPAGKILEEKKYVDEKTIDNNCNTECDCGDKVAKEIDSLASKNNLKKLERYAADILYTYDINTKTQYKFTLAIEDGKLSLLNDTSVEATEAGDYLGYDENLSKTNMEKIFKTTPKKLLYIDRYSFGHAVVLYVIDENGDLYTLNTDTRGIESGIIKKKPNELTFSKVDMKNNKLIDFYTSKNGDKKYYVSTTEGKILELNDIYEIKSFKELN